MRTKDLPRILFLDIETVSEHPHYEDLSADMQKHWLHKSKFLKTKDNSTDAIDHAKQLYKDKAGIYAEFAKIVCISAGFISVKKDEVIQLRTRSFYGHDEQKILETFANVLNKHFNRVNRYYLCGHNLREFDVPFICRRMLIHGIKLPAMLNIPGKRPWQTPHLIDTLEYWKFGDYKNYTSLDLLTQLFGIPSPKDDMDGSLVGKAYWEDDNLADIVKYCEKDVASVVNLYFKFNGIPIISEDKIISTTEYLSDTEEE